MDNPNEELTLDLESGQFTLLRRTISYHQLTCLKRVALSLRLKGQNSITGEELEELLVGGEMCGISETEVETVMGVVRGRAGLLGELCERLETELINEVLESPGEVEECSLEVSVGDAEEEAEEAEEMEEGAGLKESVGVAVAQLVRCVEMVSMLK
jgi:hypothetical protein